MPNKSQKRPQQYVQIFSKMPIKNTESLKLYQLNQTSQGRYYMSYLMFCNSTLHPFCFISTVSAYLLDFSIPNNPSPPDHDQVPWTETLKLGECL